MNLKTRIQPLIERLPWTWRRLYYKYAPHRINWRFVYNYILHRYPSDFKDSLIRNHGLCRDTLRISLFTASACDLHCEECIMQHSMAESPTYQLSIELINNFISASEKSCYTFEIILSGGEPLLWKNLKQGTKTLKSSKICSKLIMFTNALQINRLDDEIVNNLDQIRVSRYSSNSENIDILIKRYPKKILVVDRTEFWPHPLEPFEDVLPCHCMNDEIWLYDGEVYACPHSHSIAHGRKVEAKLSHPLKENFLAGLHAIKLAQQKAVCRNCISNHKVRIKTKKISNIRNDLRFLPR